MNRIKSDYDFSELIGKSIIQVCIGFHEILLNIEDDIYISIEGKFSFHEESSGNPSSFIEAAENFAELIGKSIVSTCIINEYTLLFKFSDGTNLYIFDSNDNHESFLIKLSDKVIVV